MRKTLVVYSSTYGSTKQYAGWIAEALSGELLESKQAGVPTLGSYDTVIWGGPLFAGNMKGIGALQKVWDCLKGKQVVLFTTGISDMTDEENIDKIQQSIKGALPLDQVDGVKLFHLQGSVNPSKLRFLDKTILSMMRKSILKKPEGERNRGDAILLKAMEQGIILEQHAIDPILEWVKK